MLSKFFSVFRTTARRNFSTAKPGSLYTWGEMKWSLGYKVTNESDVLTPRKVPGFSNNVTKVSMGPYHTAVITENGELWTFGLGKEGALGHYNSNDQTAPRRVQYFTDKKVRLRDVVCGRAHTIAVSEEGVVYSWGFNGSRYFGLSNLVQEPVSALGYGSGSNVTAPQAIQGLDKVSSIASGNDYAIAINKEHDLLIWGKGTAGVFGEGLIRNIKYPVVNETVHNLKQKAHVNFQRIKCAQRSTIGLTHDGHVFAWGSNTEGQLGTKTDFAVTYPDYVAAPTRLVEKFMPQGRKVVDLDVSENLSIFLLDNNQVFWSGHKLAFVPFEVELPAGLDVAQVATSTDTLAVLGKDNKIYHRHDFVKGTTKIVEYGLKVTDSSLFGKGQILSIGGTYHNRYAVVRE